MPSNNDNVIGYYDRGSALRLVIAHAGRQVVSRDGNSRTILTRNRTIRVHELETDAGIQFIATPISAPEHYAVAGDSMSAVEASLQKILGLY